jgi:hypothetical protein
MLIGFLWESQKERYRCEDLDLGRWIILKWNLEIKNGTLWVGLIWLRIGTTDFLSSFSMIFGNFLSSCATGSFSRTPWGWILSYNGKEIASSIEKQTEIHCYD